MENLSFKKVFMFKKKKFKISLALNRCDLEKVNVKMKAIQ